MTPQELYDQKVKEARQNLQSGFITQDAYDNYVRSLDDWAEQNIPTETADAYNKYSATGGDSGYQALRNQFGSQVTQRELEQLMQQQVQQAQPQQVHSYTQTPAMGVQPLKPSGQFRQGPAPAYNPYHRLLNKGK